MSIVIGAISVAFLASIAPPAGAATSSTASKAKSEKDFPSVSVQDVKTGKSVAVPTLAVTGKAMLFWFWSPN